MLSEIPFGYDFVKKNNGKLADAELARIGLIAELDAVNLYEQLAALAEDPLLKKVFLDIAREEKEHVGEFLELLKRLDSEQVRAIEHGAKEVREMEE
ncbi:MAG TPA: rubrerythrin [Euryarchaeota archaeon]|nr:rubrerythrin [Euryarchaeota archaeon]